MLRLIMWLIALFFATSSLAMETYICTGSADSYRCYLYSSHEPEYLEDVIHVHEADTSDSYGNTEPYPEEDSSDYDMTWLDKYLIVK